MSEKEKRKLTPKQERFCNEYIKTSATLTSAAQSAGYSPNNEAAAAATASRLLRKAAISARVEELKAKQVKRIQIDADEILLELKRLALSDLSQAFDDAGFMRPLSEIPEDVRRSLVSLEVSEIFAGQGDDRSIIGHLKKPRFHDKTKALELLGKHLKLFADRVEHSGPNGKPIETLNHSTLTDEQLEAQIARLLPTKPEGT